MRGSISFPISIPEVVQPRRRRDSPNGCAVGRGANLIRISSGKKDKVEKKDVKELIGHVRPEIDAGSALPPVVFRQSAGEMMYETGGAAENGELGC